MAGVRHQPQGQQVWGLILSRVIPKAENGLKPDSTRNVLTGCYTHETAFCECSFLSETRPQGCTCTCIGCSRGVQQQLPTALDHQELNLNGLQVCVSVDGSFQLLSLDSMGMQTFEYLCGLHWCAAAGHT